MYYKIKFFIHLFLFFCTINAMDEVTVHPVLDLDLVRSRSSLMLEAILMEINKLEGITREKADFQLNLLKQKEPTCEELVLFAKEYDLRPAWGIEGAIAKRLVCEKETDDRYTKKRNGNLFGALFRDKERFRKYEYEELHRNLVKSIESGSIANILHELGEGALVGSNVFSAVARHCYADTKEDIALARMSREFVPILIKYQQKLNHEVLEIQWLLKQISLQGPGGSMTAYKLLMPHLTEYCKNLYNELDSVLKKGKYYETFPSAAFMPPGFPLIKRVAYGGWEKVLLTREQIMLRVKPIFITLVLASIVTNFSSRSLVLQGIILLSLFPLYICGRCDEDAVFLIDCLGSLIGGFCLLYFFGNFLSRFIEVRSNFWAFNANLGFKLFDSMLKYWLKGIEPSWFPRHRLNADLPNRNEIIRQFYSMAARRLFPLLMIYNILLALD